MSQELEILQQSFGTPLCWLFSANGEVLRVFDQKPLSAYVYEFEYNNTEDESDTCTIKLKFDKMLLFNLSYIQQDVVIQVQYGFVLNNGESIKSPLYKVAIRDIDADYKPDGLEVELKCTDLIDYLKDYKSQTINHYDTQYTKEERATNDKFEGYFVDWLKEIGKGNHTTTITLGKTSARIDKIGTITNFEYDEKTGKHTQVRDNARALKKLYAEFDTLKIKKAGSKALTQAIQEQLNMLNQANNSPLMMDSTGDNLDIKNRNFKQDVFKSYIWGGGTGELLTFNSSTNTRKVKEDKAVNSGLNPYNKTIETVTIETADTGKGNPGGNSSNKNANEDFNAIMADLESKRKAKLTPVTKEPIPILDEEKFKKELKLHLTGKNEVKPTKEMIEKWAVQAREIFQYNINNPLNMKKLPPLKYTVVRKYLKDPYMSDGLREEVVTIPAQTIINMPEFGHIRSKIASEVRAQLNKHSVLIGYTLEKTQRKYEATAEVIGDPTLVKGKIYKFDNLGRLDRGRWYATEVTHKFTMSGGYITTLNLIRQPSEVNVATRTYSANPVFDRSSNNLDFKKETTEKMSKYFSDEVDNQSNNPSSLDTGSKADETKTFILDNTKEVNSTEDFNSETNIGFEPDSFKTSDEPNNDNT